MTNEMNAAKIAELNACNRFLMVFVLRAAAHGDCTNNGLSAQHDALFIPHPEGPFTLDETKGRAVELIGPAFPGCPIRVKPRGEKRHTMAGGNFLHTSDGRFSRMYGAPLSIHDRIE